jgi:cytochrome c-type biogenesis protein CcmH/NrfG
MEQPYPPAPVETSVEPIGPSEESLPVQTAQREEPSLSDLEAETEANPDNYLTWQKLGDAYAASGDLAKALTAYNKAESILIHTK